MGVCCYTFLKYTVMIFNLLYMMMGGALLGFMLWVYLSGDYMVSFTNDTEGTMYVYIFLMVVGAIMFIMGLLGCCGACQESQCMLATFFALVLVLLMGQVAFGVWLRANEKRFTHSLTKTLTSVIKQEYGEEDNKKTKAFDVIQRDMQCCGSEGPTDWIDSKFNGARDEEFTEIGVSAESAVYNVPKSCCIEPDCDTKLEINRTVDPSNPIYIEGCSKKMLNKIMEYSYEILAVLLAVLLLQVLAMIFSMVFCCTVRRIDHVKA